MDKVAHMFGEKVGDMVEGAVKNALGVKDKDEKKGGIKSLFGGDKKTKKKEKEKGGIFSFGDDKKKEHAKGGFISKIFDKDNGDDGGIHKASGFTGLFSEREGASAAGGDEEDAVGTGEEGDFFNDLNAVAEEMSQGN